MDWGFDEDVYNFHSLIKNMFSLDPVVEFFSALGNLVLCQITTISRTKFLL